MHAFQKQKRQVKPKVPKTETSKSAQSTSAPKDAQATVQRKPRAKPAPKPKAMPRPTWTALNVPLSLSELDPRIAIREFVHRFDGTLQVSMANVEELEELVGDTIGGGDEWEDDPQELVGWVSEACVKAIVIGLLEVISGRAAAIEAAEFSRTIKETVKTVRSSGANLNRIWSALTALRYSARRCDGGLGKSLVKYPEPLPPPLITTYRSTRSGGASDTGINIACTAQLVPIIAFLVNQAVDSPAIREAIDLGVTDVKDISQGAKEAILKENARYKEQKEQQKEKEKVKGEFKALRLRHNQAVQDLELGQKLALSAYAPRFSPLGRDSEGRVYYALTASASECEAAEKLVTGKGSGKVKLRGFRGAFGEQERKEMKRWSWFLCVHGPKPEDALVAKEVKIREEDGSESELSDQEEDLWWGFWDPAEVRKLAGWLAMKHGLDEEDDDHKDTEDEEPKAGPSSSKLLSSSTDANPSKSKPINGKAKPNGNARGRPSTTATSSSRSSLKGKSRDISPLSDLSSSRASSPQPSSSSSELSDLDSDVEMEDDFEQYTRPTAGKSELRALVKGLTEYAEMLQWRISRVSPEDGTQSASNPREKEKATLKEMKPVSTSLFYA